MKCGTLPGQPTDNQAAIHAEQTLLALADEFLIQYLLCARNGFHGNQIFSRLFSMGHALELYAKAALVEPDGSVPFGHDVPRLLEAALGKPAFSEDETAAGNALFNPSVTNVDLGLWEEHKEALEIYQATVFLKDLKYYLRRDGSIIYPARMSLRPVNWRLLKLVKELRGKAKHPRTHADEQLKLLVRKIGFDKDLVPSLL